MQQTPDIRQPDPTQHVPANSPIDMGALLDAPRQSNPISVTEQQAEHMMPPSKGSRWLFIGLALFLLSSAGFAVLLLRPSVKAPASIAATNIADRYASTNPPSSIQSLIPERTESTTITTNGLVTIAGGLIIEPSTLGQLQPTVGELFYDKPTNQLYYYNGTTYVSAQGSVGPQGPAGANGRDGVQGPQGPAGSSADAILNQTSSPQAAGFSITGSGVAGIFNATGGLELHGVDITTTGALNNVAYLSQANTFTQANTFSVGVLTPQLDTSSATPLTIGGTNATVINLDQDTVLAGNTSLTVNGDASFKDATNSSAAFQVQNASGVNLFSVDTANNALVFGNDGNPGALTIRGGTASGDSAQGANLTFAASNGTGAGGSGDLTFQTAGPAANTDITLDNYQSASFGGNTNTTVTWSHTPNSTTNSILLVSIVSARNQAVATNGVTYEGTPLTKLSSQLCGNANFPPYCEVELWYMVDPPTSGNHQISVTLTPGSSAIAGGSATYDNINTATPFGLVSTISGSTAANQQITNHVATTSTRQLVIDALASDNATTNPGGTQLWSSSANSFAFNNGSSNAATGSTTNVSWYINSGDYADIAVPLNPVASTVPDTLTDRLHITSAGNIGINNSNPQYTLDVAGTARLQSSANSTTEFQIQNTSGAALFTADTTNMKITVTALAVSTTLTVSGHIVTGGTTPTITAGSAACTSPTVNVAGDDTAGVVTITTGSGCSGSGQLASITFSNAYAAAPQVLLSAANSAGSLLPTYTTTTTTAFTISTPNTPTSVTTYIFSYYALQ